MMKINFRNSFVATIAIIGLLLTILWRVGLLGLWTEGMGFITNNTTDYSDKNGYTIQESYTVSIDLSDLESNIGKVLYDDGKHNVYVAWVNHSGNIKSGAYSIGFRSIGDYSLSGATLISGLHHKTLGEHSFTTEMSASMTAEYKSKSYSSSHTGLSGINYRDGDDFSFDIFPLSAYESNEVTVNETGIVHLTVTNLYKNIWSEN
ncbi:hypothetical protein ACX93W_21795 [Paenibacillus sp. CAU 1782]